VNDKLILTALILGLGYYHYHDLINELINQPYFYLYATSSIFLFILLYFFVGYHLERLLNRFQMWKQGIKFDSSAQRVAYPFLSFDLQKALDKFYKDKNNGEKTFVGLNAEKSNKEVVCMPDTQRSQHLQVLGMTGTGKTTTIFLPLIYQDALKGRPIIILDAKGEMSFINYLNAVLSATGRSDDFMLFSLSHKDISCTYNPLYVGECDPQIVIDAFFNNFRDENSFYREMAKTIFTNAFFILHSIGKPFTPMDVYTYLTNLAARQSVNKQIKEGNETGMIYLTLLNTVISRLIDQYKGWEHVITGFNNYLLSHRDSILNDDDSDIILTDIIRQRKIVYFQLPTNAYPIQSVSIARMVQANLRYISSLVQIGQLPKDIQISVIIDEYASFAEETFVEVLSKARSSGMMVTLAHQSLSDLKAISEPFMKRIDENTLNKIYLKQTDPELCELIAKSLGTYVKEEKTFRMVGGRFGNQIHNGESSNRLINEFLFPPDKIKNLNKYGQGYFVYRGNNSHQCVNLGSFKNVEEIPYKKKIKKNKNKGLKLFEKYYLENSKIRIKEKKLVQSCSVNNGVIECDD
jgi:hypothetical protein